MADTTTATPPPAPLTGAIAPTPVASAPLSIPAANPSVPPNEETILLVCPITIGGAVTPKLTMRRPKVQDRYALDQRTDITDVQREALLFGMLAGLAPEELGLLDLADYAQIQEKYQAFTSARPPKR